MNTQNPEHTLGVTAAFAWLAAWVFIFIAIGVNHLLTREPDGPKLFVVAGVLAAFLASLRYVSSQPHANAALASNVIAVGAILFAAVLFSRNPALMALRWSSGQYNSMLVVSWVWVALIWLSIICAGGIAEVHHVFHSRAR